MYNFMRHVFLGNGFYNNFMTLYLFVCDDGLHGLILG